MNAILNKCIFSVFLNAAELVVYRILTGREVLAAESMNEKNLVKNQLRILMYTYISINKV